MPDQQEPEVIQLDADILIRKLREALSAKDLYIAQLETRIEMMQNAVTKPDIVGATDGLTMDPPPREPQRPNPGDGVRTLPDW